MINSKKVRALQRIILFHLKRERNKLLKILLVFTLKKKLYVLMRTFWRFIKIHLHKFENQLSELQFLKMKTKLSKKSIWLRTITKNLLNFTLQRWKKGKICQNKYFKVWCLIWSLSLIKWQKLNKITKKLFKKQLRRRFLIA